MRSSKGQKRTPSKASTTQLPNAPLVEVVFELRWKVVGDESTPMPFRQDPGYLTCLDSFVPTMKDFGFPERKRSQPDGPFTVAHSVEYRFYHHPDKLFPVIQIGPGLFAVNQSSEYIWSDYKKLCLNALTRLMDSYPRLRTNPFLPIQLELKYIDALQPLSPGEGDLISFLSQSTNMCMSLPGTLKSAEFGPPNSGGINFSFPIRGKKDTNFRMLISTGVVSDVQSIILQSSVVSVVPSAGLGSTPSVISKRVAKWLEDAHSCTSPFFKAFVKSELLAKYRESKHA
jgi:uncharacterized protein (TIGR04255 family)